MLLQDDPLLQSLRYVTNRCFRIVTALSDRLLTVYPAVVKLQKVVSRNFHCCLQIERDYGRVSSPSSIFDMDVKAQRTGMYLQRCRERTPCRNLGVRSNTSNIFRSKNNQKMLEPREIISTLQVKFGGYIYIFSTPESYSQL